ncbi:unnamed protein product [Victoria cruziana]
MAPGRPTANGGLRPPSSGESADGDDEREEGEEVEDAEEEGEPPSANGEEEEGQEEDEEDEPRLKYQRMGGSIPSLLSNDAASAISVAERMIALGTHDGAVHILDFQGNQIKEFLAHTATVNDLSFDSDGEYIGSCSNDGTVVVNGLFTDEILRFEYHRPMKTIALDPEYSRKSSRRFIAGGLAGNLFLNAKGWLGYRDQILHSGEGPIHAVRWRTSLIAWANDAGVKVYDMANDQRITFIEKPRGSPRPELLLPHLVWQDDVLLVIAWGNTVKIAAIRTISLGSNATQGRFPSSSAKQVDIVASFQAGYYISGIAPYGDALVILAYIPEEMNGEKGASTVPRQGTAQRPEVRVVTWKNDELATDALSIHGFEHYKAKDYALSYAPFSGSSYAGGQWAAGDEPLYYIVSPKDVVIAKPRDAEDHISWLLQRGWHEKALAAVEAGQGRTELLDEVGAKYLDHLILERKYAEAASLCPKLLRSSTSSWERWVFHFAHLRQLPVLVPYIPTSNPQLRDTAYEVALVSLATNPSFHKELLSTVKSWPPNIYSALPVISAIEPQLRSASVTETLKEALAELYVLDKKYEKALGLYAELKNPEIFQFIERHSLQDAVHDKVAHLMELDAKRSVSLFIQRRATVSPFEVVSQLMEAKSNADYRYFIHLYLHSLFEVDPNAGRDFHDLQVELYAEYEPPMLLPFLRSSQHYRLDKAQEICVKKNLLREQVFILGRMGIPKRALSVLINKLEDMEEAIEFVTLQNDSDLWEELIKQSLSKPEMVAKLLEHTVGNLDPLYIVNMVPQGMHIPRLRDHLVKIITDYRTETSLRHGCNDILKADCVNLLVKYYSEARHAICISNEEDEVQSEMQASSSSRAASKTEGIKAVGVKSKMRAGARCCMCFDPFIIQNVSVVVFFCCHAYHVTCLESATDALSSRTKRTGSSSYVSESDEEGDDTGFGAPGMRCILCTTAAS